MTEQMRAGECVTERGVERVWEPGEMKALMDAWSAELRRRYPGLWVGDLTGDAREMAYKRKVFADMVARGDAKPEDAIEPD